MVSKVKQRNLLPAENLLEDTDGWLRPPATHHCPLSAVTLRHSLSADTRSSDDVIAFRSKVGWARHDEGI